MKKLVMKKRIIVLGAMICAGMLLFTGCAGTEAETGTEEMEASTEMEPITQDDSKAEPAVDDEKRTQEQDTFVDGNDMLDSADLMGPASGCSDAGCMINPDSFVYVDEDGNSTSGNRGITKVVYTDDTVFQKATIKSDGSSSDYSLEDGEKSELKDKDFVACFGKQQEDGTYLADRIILITFN